MNRDQTFGLIRHVLTIVGGMLVQKGLLEEGQVPEALGAIMSLLAVGWSVQSKFRK